MKVEELIRRLQDHLREYGNTNVIVSDDYADFFEIGGDDTKVCEYSTNNEFVIDTSTPWSLDPEDI